MSCKSVDDLKQKENFGLINIKNKQDYELKFEKVLKTANKELEKPEIKAVFERLKYK